MAQYNPYGFKAEMLEANSKDFTIAGRSCTTYPVYCINYEPITKARRRYENQEVPGRSGDLTYDLNSFGNVRLAYTFAVAQNGIYYLNRWLNFLLSLKGYNRIECGYEENYYRQGRICDVTGIVISEDEPIYGRTASAVVTFDCKPQKWLTGGENWETLTNGGYANNSLSMFDAAPLYRLHGAGTIRVGASSLTIDADLSDDGIYFDAELMDAYIYRYGVAQSYNSHVTLAGSMKVPPGYNQTLVQLSGGITAEMQLRSYEI